MTESMQNEGASRTRGGRRPNAGRPSEYREPLLRKTVTLPVSYVEQLEVLGRGILSDGIRRLVESAHTPSGHLWLRPPRTDP